MSLTPEQAFSTLKLLNPRLIRIHHPGAAGTMKNAFGTHYRVYAYPHLAYFTFEAEIVWPEGMTEFPVLEGTE